VASGRRPKLGGISWQSTSFGGLPLIVDTKKTSSKFYRAEMKHLIFSILLECLSSDADVRTRKSDRYRCFISQVYRTFLYYFHVMSDRKYEAMIVLCVCVCVCVCVVCVYSVCVYIYVCVLYLQLGASCSLSSPIFTHPLKYTHTQHTNTRVYTHTNILYTHIYTYILTA
jgi:hypothetical protein